jgi:hypothetical protein
LISIKCLGHLFKQKAMKTVMTSYCYNHPWLLDTNQADLPKEWTSIYIYQVTMHLMICMGTQNH